MEAQAIGNFNAELIESEEELHKPPSSLVIDDLDASFLRHFLADLEARRGISARSRNQRLAAIRSCFRFASLYLPEKSQLIQQVLAIPSKRYERKLVEYLSESEIEALLAAPDKTTWSGLRDYTLLLLAIQTGLRVAELRTLRRHAVHLGASSHVCCTGKGRKERATPLTKQTARELKLWLALLPVEDNTLVFPNSRGSELSTDGVAYIITSHATAAANNCSSLTKKRISPHVLRHTAAMRLLQAGVDRTVIALWLGHESIETTAMYLEADLYMKQRAVDKTAFIKTTPGRFRPTDKLLTFLNEL